MNPAFYTLDSILRESFNCHKYTVICSLLCFIMIVFFSKLTAKFEHILVYLPLLCNLPIYMWCFAASKNLIDEFSQMATAGSPSPYPFDLAAINQFIPLIIILLLSLIMAMIINTNNKFTGLKLHNIQHVNLLPAIMIGLVSIDWILVWYTIQPRFYAFP